MQKIILSIIIVILIVLAFRDEKTEVVTITKVNNFEECLLAGYPVQESYPRRCVSPDGKAFSEYIGNRIEKQDLIVVDSPLPNQTINSAFQISGKARGFWFFEGEISGRVLDQSKKTISNFSIMTENEWMTEEFVSFNKIIELGTTTLPQRGYIEIIKNNPSEMREKDDSLIIPISFSSSTIEIPQVIAQ